MFGSRGREFGSRGKGNRRSPVGHRVRHTRGSSEWRKQALHAVAGLAALEEPRVCLALRGSYRDEPEHLIYRLDQQMARAGIAYRAECWGHGRGFAIYVTARYKAEVREIIARLVASPGG